jgi:hypothetical protein
MSTKPLDSLILTVRGHKVILDADLAELYGVPTKRLNEQVKRNAERFPADFMFQLTAKEAADLRSQFATSSSHDTGHERETRSNSQPAAGSHGGRRTNPYAFTEHGALMAANVLNSPEAVKMSVYVIRAFIKQRELLTTHADVLERLALLDARLLRHDAALRVIWRELQPLLAPPPSPPKPEIGFHAGERSQR